HERKGCHTGNALLHASQLGAAQEIRCHPCSLRPFASIQLTSSVVSANVGTVREESPLLAVLHAFVEYALGAFGVVDQNCIEQLSTVGSGSVVLEPVLERERETALKRAIARAVASAQQRATNLAERV